MSTAARTGVVSRTCVKTADGVIKMVELEVPEPAGHEALVAIRMSTVCGSDIHYVDDFPMPKDIVHLAMGHEMVGTVVAVGATVRSVRAGDRVVASCLYGCGTCASCQRGLVSCCERYGSLPGVTNLLTGCQGDYIVVPHADVNMAKVPDGVSDDQAILATDIMSTGFAAVERGGVSAGDTVAVFAQGPVGLCATATAAARARGAGQIIAIESIPERVELARQLGATTVLAPSQAGEGLAEATNGRGVDVAIEALGR